MGPSGSGKSTLLHILGILDEVDAGTCHLQNTDLTTLADRELSRIRNQYFGFIFQSFNLFNEFSAIENVMFPLIKAGVPRPERRERAELLLSQAELNQRLYHYPNMLSGGVHERIHASVSRTNRQLLNNPAYREVLVDVLIFGEAELTTPVAEVDLDKARGSLLTVDDMTTAAESIPAVDYAYVLQRTKVVATTAVMRFEAEEKGRDDRSADRSRGETEESKAAYEDKDTDRVEPEGTSSDATEAGGTEQGRAEDQAREVQTEAADNRRAPQLDRTVITELPVDEFPGYTTSTDFFTAYGLSAAEGTLFIQDDLDAGNLVIVLGSELAETLFPGGGAVGARISLP